jgi:tetratricopeptide (TPR) repeat protein
MSLLLQALKKAEEDKRRRAALVSTDEVEGAAEVAFPALNLVEAETTDQIVQADVAAESNEWDFVQFEMTGENNEPPSEIQTELEASNTAEIKNTTDGTLFAEAPPQAPEVQTQAVAEFEEKASVVETPPVDRIQSVIAEPVTTTTAPIPSSISPPTHSQAVAKTLFAKSKKQPARGLLPWLLLGAGLLLAGMVAWFAWQYRQLTQPITKIETRSSLAEVASSVAAEPMHTNEAIVSNALEVNTPADGTHAEESALVSPVSAPLPEKADTKPTSAAKTITDSRELNPPLKFVRQSPHLSAPDPVMLAWQAYQDGDLEQAELLYRKALLVDPRQRDALLGLAAIAQQRGDLSTASALYQRILRTNPQDESAKAALLMLNSAQMPEQEAVQLEQSGKSDPMTLGQYFAAQQRWSQAQEQFFLAYSANPNNADAALNLAVSLDHLKQTALAKTYYRKALQSKESNHFDRSKVEQRLAELDAASGLAP